MVTLLPIIDPWGTAVLYLAISSHLTVEERKRQILRACLYMTGILIAFLFGGHFIILAFGISIPGIRLAGGLIIGFLGFRMLFPEVSKIGGEGQQEAMVKPDISFSPLAMPSLAGPGSMAAVLAMSSSIDSKHMVDRVVAFAGVVVAIIIAAVISWLMLRGAGAMRRFLGVNGIDSLSRIMGFLLICIGIQFAIEGVRDLVLDTSFWQE